MNTFWKIVLSSLMIFPMYFASFIVSLIIVTILPILRIYKDPSGWAPESLIGSALIWAIPLAVIFTILFIRFNLKRKD